MTKSRNAKLYDEQSKSYINFSFADITPKRATEILATNHINNRSLSQSTINKYADMMQKGMWHVAGCEAIKLSSDGVLVDGQHRLTAIVQANRTITMLLITGVPKKVFSTLDTGKTRSLNDAMKISGITVKGGVQRASSSLNIVYRIMDSFNRGLSTSTTRRVPLCNSVALEFLKTQPRFLNTVSDFYSCYQGYKIAKNFNVTAACAMNYFFVGISEEIDEALTIINASLQHGTTFDDFKHESAITAVLNHIKDLRGNGKGIDFTYYLSMYAFMLEHTLNKTKAKTYSHIPKDFFNQESLTAEIFKKRFTEVEEKELETV